MQNYLSAPFRRHLVSGCKHGYDRSDETSTEPKLGSKTYKKDLAADCECPIVVNGRLNREVDEKGKSKRLRYISTGVTDWETANKHCEKWVAWEGLIPPENSHETLGRITVDEAVRRYLDHTGPKGRNVDPSTLKKHEILCNNRLIPFCQSKGITFLKSFESKPLCDEFFQSWTNLNPHHNKTNVEWIDQPLKDSYKRVTLENFRAFLRYCVESGWISENQAVKIKFKSTKATKKYGFTLPEFAHVMKAIQQYPDSRKQTGQLNSQRLRAFCLTMRYAGLRVSDATALNSSQLMLRDDYNPQGGWCLSVYQEKTREWVRVPIPMFVVDELKALPFRFENDGKKFWFWTGSTDGTTKNAIKTWRRTIDNLFSMAQEPDENGVYRKPFSHPGSTHAMRHTFAITHLNAGTPVKTVSRWLGHSSTAVTELHYAHANSATHEAGDREYDESIRKQLGAA
jgi:integrase